MHACRKLLNFWLFAVIAMPSCLALRPAFIEAPHPARHMLQDGKLLGKRAALCGVSNPKERGKLCPGSTRPNCCLVVPATLHVPTDLSPDYLHKAGPSSADDSAPGRRTLLAASIITSMQKCVGTVAPYRCPAPANDPTSGVLVFTQTSPALNALAGALNSFTLPATTLTRAQLAPNVRLVMGVRGVDLGFEPTITIGGSTPTSQTLVGTLVNTGNGNTLTAPGDSSAFHTFWIPNSYVLAPGATTVKVVLAHCLSEAVPKAAWSCLRWQQACHSSQLK